MTQTTQTTQSQMQPALKVFGLDGEANPLTVENDVFRICEQQGFHTDLARILVPKDTHRFAAGRVNPRYMQARGFAILCFRSHIAAASAMSKLKYAEYKYKGCVLSFAWDTRANERATATAAAAAALVKTEALKPPPNEQGRGEVNCLDYPALPMPVAKRAPVLIAKPEVHIVRTPAPSSAGSTASGLSGLSGLSCYYCKAVGHSVKDCSQLSTRLCQECGLFGHTEARCPMLRLLCDDVPTTEIFAAY